MPHFANPEYFNYAWWLPLGFAVLWLYAQWRKSKISGLADNTLLGTILPGYQDYSFIRSGILILAGSAMIILALANPLGTSKPVKKTIKGLDIVVALDVSNSMNARDLKPSRLDRAIRFIKKIQSAIPGSHTGFVVFAGRAYVQMPLTSDPGALDMFLKSINTDMVPEQGTNISDAIETSKELLFPDENDKLKSATSKVILLITDGEDHEENAIKAARDAHKQGVTIITIAVGSAAGAPVPQLAGDAMQGYIKDNNGETVISKVNLDLLKDIANETNGASYRLTDDDNLVPVLNKKLDGLKKGEQTVTYDLNETRFQWFCGLALFLLLAEDLLKTRVKKMQKPV
jgi:Ca-activated chloride channel homolog